MPDVSTVHFDVALTNVSLAWRNNALVAPILAPEVMVRRQSDRYFIHDPQREAFRQISDARAPGAEAGEVDFALSHDAYYCDDHALESAIPDEERANADAPLQPEIDRTEFLTDRILLNAEISLAAKLRDHSTIPGVNLADTHGWDDADDGDPLADVETARTAILDSVQQLPNTLVMPQAVYTAVRNHPSITDRVKYTGSGAIGASTLAELFDVDRVVIARAVRNTSNPGQAPVMAPVWGKDALLMYVPPRVSLKSVAPAITFVWSLAGGSSRGASVQSWREERRKSTMIRVQKYYDQKIVAPGAAYLLRNAVA